MQLFDLYGFAPIGNDAWWRDRSPMTVDKLRISYINDTPNISLLIDAHITLPVTYPHLDLFLLSIFCQVLYTHEFMVRIYNSV